MKTNIELAKQLGLDQEELFCYGDWLAKIKLDKFVSIAPRAKKILITAINPTKAGEGKTTTAIGLADRLNSLGHQTILTLREPSMGPVFGLKGTATGGGECQLYPSLEINLHHTGDFHAITMANNLVSTVIDNIIYWGNELNIDPNNIIWQRCLDINDRSLREVVITLKKDLHRKEHFQITAASEMMAILSMADNKEDLTARINRSIVAYTYDNQPITIENLHITEALLTILAQAMLPNLVQSKYGTPALIHCGPFANISHGLNSLISLRLGTKLSDYVVFESGFGSDLGFEKYQDLVNQHQDLTPDCTVLVVTLQALKLHGGLAEDKLTTNSLADLEKGIEHLEQHLHILGQYQVNFVVCINQHQDDFEDELTYLANWLSSQNISYAINDSYELGLKSSDKLANLVVKICQQPQKYQPLFVFNNTNITEKITTIVNKIYQVNNIQYTEKAAAKITEYNNSIYKNWPVCMAKNHQTISGNAHDDKSEIMIQDIKLNTGAGYFIVYLGKITTMPGLNKTPRIYQFDKNKI